MVRYQYDVMTTLNSGYDTEKREAWAVWVDTDNNLWYTVGVKNTPILGEERKKVFKAFGYPADKETDTSPE